MHFKQTNFALNYNWLQYNEELYKDLCALCGKSFSIMDPTDTRSKKAISYWALYRFSTRTDTILNVLAVIFSAISGATLPATTLVFGQLIDTFGMWQIQAFPGQLVTSDELSRSVNEKSLYFVYLAALAFVTTYVFMAIFVYTSEASSFRIRKAYLKAVMRQNIGWFDQVGAGEVATRITNDTLLIQDGIGEKVPLCVASLATFLSGFVIAFIKVSSFHF